jgi:acetyl esterase/lipase
MGGVDPLRFGYGSDPSQWADLYLPVGRPRGVAVVIHGGFWKAEYGAEYGAPVAVDLAARGWWAWNIEYRRVGNGGGIPTTLDDVAAAIDRLAEVPDVPLAGPVIAVGHSAGGHLAVWAAARGRAGWPERVPLTGVVSQAGVLDLAAAHLDRLGGGAVARFVGEQPIDACVDPASQQPVAVPVACVHGRDDEDVPVTQSEQYVERALAAGATATLTVVDGDHYCVIDPASPAWPAVIAAVELVAAPQL